MLDLAGFFEGDCRMISRTKLKTCMKLTECKVGLLINFNVVRLQDGIRRLSLADGIATREATQ
jgi:hypothetical protein